MTQISSFVSQTCHKDRRLSFNRRFHFRLCVSVVMTACDPIPIWLQSLPSVTTGHSRLLPQSSNMDGRSALGVSVCMVLCEGLVTSPGWIPPLVSPAGDARDTMSETAAPPLLDMLLLHALHVYHDWWPPPRLTEDSSTAQIDSFIVNISLRRCKQKPLFNRLRTGNSCRGSAASHGTPPHPASSPPALDPSTDMQLWNCKCLPSDGETDLKRSQRLSAWYYRGGEQMEG